MVGLSFQDFHHDLVYWLQDWQRHGPINLQNLYELNVPLEHYEENEGCKALI